MSRKKKPFVSLAIFFTAILLLLSFWVIRQNSNNPGEPLLIHDVVISTELDDTRRLTGALSRFPYGSRQLVLRFNYSKATKGSEIRILWFVEDKLVRSDSYTLSASSGSKIYCLTLESGLPLPEGSYSVGILNKSERISDFRFEIY